MSGTLPIDSPSIRVVPGARPSRSTLPATSALPPDRADGQVCVVGIDCHAVVLSGSEEARQYAFGLLWSVPACLFVSGLMYLLGAFA
jgi:hypothetical protein